MALSPLSTSDVDDTFKWTVTKASGGGYIITNKGTEDVLLSGETGGVFLGDPIPTSSSDYRKSVWAPTAQSYYVNLSSFTVSGGNTLVAGDSRTISPKVTPSNATHTAAHWFKWESSDPSVATVDANGRITGITEGTATITVTHKPTNRVRQCTITVEQVIPDGVYFFENKEVGKYMQPHNTYLGAPFALRDFNGQNNQRWQLTHVSEGYYKIVSVDSGYAATALSATNTDITQKAYTGALGQLWKIMEVSDGVYELSPKLNSSHYMVVGNEYNVQIGTAQSGDGDEWRLTRLEEFSNIFLDYNVPSKIFIIQCIGSEAQGSTWYPLIQASASAWNATVSSNITVSASVSSQYTCEVGAYAEDWYGLTRSYVISGDTIGAEIYINSLMCASGENPRKSTITHEIGHLLGLADNPPVGNDSSLMRHERNRNIIYAPQAFDIANVTYIYGN